jgi:hypothetical protein
MQVVKTYAHYGHTDFVGCLGSKGDVICDDFLDYKPRNRDVTVTLGSRALQNHGAHGEGSWKPEPSTDGRRFFAHTWCAREFEACGLTAELAQCSASWKRTRGTVRGLHVQPATAASRS